MSMTPPSPADVLECVSAILGALLRDHPALSRVFVKDVLMLASLPWETSEATAQRFGMSRASLIAWCKRVGWRHGLCMKMHDRRRALKYNQPDTWVRTPAGDALFQFHHARGTTPETTATTTAPGTTTAAT
jgi:hypothetical protein